MQSYTLITGACGHLGRAFVNECRKRNENLILTGRSEEKLLALQEEIKGSGYPQTVKIYPLDLADENSRNVAFEKMKTDGVTISRLINVAGADIQKGFSEYTQEKISFQCRANFEGALATCKAALEMKGERLEIVNISSVSGIYPMPYFAIYSATKSALTSFSMSLREEMKGKGVFVTAILPGAMPTREDIKEQIQGQGLWGKLAAKSPEFVAKKSLNAVRKNKKKYIPGFFNRV
ncbi:MAG: SDR family NAD(P)-dependent oxidoreductase, partial [Clostridia bacterium]|nr:SDR family NAD(P)-dependent oxidoreductase [Clostridia bacterium]